LDIAEVSRNTKLSINGVPFAVEDVKFVKPGKGRAMYYLKLRNLFDGTTRDQTYHSGDKVDCIDLYGQGYWWKTTLQES
jgi:elongation factor P